MKRGQPSVVEDQGLYASSCGYCKSNARTSVAYGLSAHSLSVYDYQDLLNRGWRRSGMFLYRPEMEKTCCPAYTIRLKVDLFSESKEQRRVKRRMERYLDGTYNGPTISIGDRERKMTSENEPKVAHNNSTFKKSIVIDAINSDVDSKGRQKTMKRNETPQEVDHILREFSSAIEAAVEACIASGFIPAEMNIPRITVQRFCPMSKKRIKASNSGVNFTCNFAFPCAAAILKHKDGDKSIIAFQQTFQSHRMEESDIRRNLPVLLAEQISLKLQNNIGLHQFKVESCKGHLNFIAEGAVASGSSDLISSCTEHSVGDAFDLRSDASEMTSTSASTFSPRFGRVQAKRQLEFRMKRSAFDPEEYALYKKYQIAVHHDKPDDVKESSYIRFLVNSPLIFVPPSKGETPPCGFGSFHQQYLLDGRLVAVGVVDILPSCLSSKYLFWDPDLAFLSLGKYSALQEIQWVQEVHKSCPSMKYYYLGYYIHSCPKMRYKAAYCPSELLCPVRFQWVLFDIACPYLEEQPYVCLSDCWANASVPKSSKITPKPEKSAVIMYDGLDGEARDMEIVDNNIQPYMDAVTTTEVASSSKESEDVSNVLLKLGNRYLQFKHLQAMMTGPQTYIDSLACDLRKYSQVVGPTLAAKMAYVLG